jgi:hypothetical protein
MTNPAAPSAPHFVALTAAGGVKTEGNSHGRRLHHKSLEKLHDFRNTGNTSPLRIASTSPAGL